MIGTTAPSAVAGTKPISAMPSASDPTEKIGSPTMSGSPTRPDENTGGRRCRERGVALDDLAVLVLRDLRARLYRFVALHL